MLENCIIAANIQGQPVFCLEGGATATAFVPTFMATRVVTGSDVWRDSKVSTIIWRLIRCSAPVRQGISGYRSIPRCAAENNDCLVLLGAVDAGCVCDCAYHCDLDLDGSFNPVDVAIIVKYVYKMQDSRMQTACAGQTGDWNC